MIYLFVNLLLSVMVKEFSVDSAKLRQKIKWHLYFRTRCRSADSPQPMRPSGVIKK